MLMLHTDGLLYPMTGPLDKQDISQLLDEAQADGLDTGAAIAAIKLLMMGIRIYAINPRKHAPLFFVDDTSCHNCHHDCDEGCCDAE